MKTTEQQTRTTTFNAVVEMKCDLCGKTVKGSDWAEKSYSVRETEVRCKVGTAYPDGGTGEETTIDICPECFVDKLVPWVREHGGTPDTQDWDF